MTVWAIIPVKPLGRAKSRLASVLAAEERQALAEALLRHVVKTVKAVPGVAGVLVISRDPRALALARDLGANTVQESGTPELNNALMRATQVITAWRGRAVLILPADLPLINGEDVVEILKLGEDEGTVVLATDRNQDGTNALFSRPPGLIPYAFGQDSFLRHLSLAKDAGAEVKVYSSERIKLDIDVPADLELLRQINPHFELPVNFSAQS
ncbi:MAG: 2-phospho-L-lactate guanylyltransferase CofC [Chloroflexi bacterium OLB15]|nr:MAG: 2-phospho-L-lactate guanylyltransferase CofC [Chloroflexi bacterium OLB15]